MSKSILVIDFDTNDAQKIAHYLTGHGYKVTVESDSDAGLREFFKNLPDFVFVNLLMPRISGVDICKKIKGRYEGERVPVYFLSPLASSLARAPKKTGAQGVLPKPIDLGRLLSIVEHHLGPAETQESGGDAGKSVVGKVPAQKAAADPAPSREGAAQAAAEQEPPRDEGSLRDVSMLEVLSGLAREGATGHLEIETETITVTLKWKDGRICGLISPDLVHHLVRTGKLTREEVVKIRRRKRQDGLDTLDAIRSLNFFSDDALDRLVVEWRTNHMREMAVLDVGLYRFFPGPVTGSFDLDPLVLVHHAVKSRYNLVDLQSLVESKTDLTGEFSLVSDVDTSEYSGEPTFVKIMEVCRKGCTLGELFNQGEDPHATLAALWGLILLDRVIQEKVTSPPVPEPVPEPAPMQETVIEDPLQIRPATGDEFFSEPEPLTEFDAEFDREFSEAFETPRETDASEPEKTGEPPAAPETLGEGNPLEEIFDDPDLAAKEFEGLNLAAARSAVEGVPPFRSAHSRSSGSFAAHEKPSDRPGSPHAVDVESAGRESEPAAEPPADLASEPQFVSIESLIRQGDDLMKESAYSRAQDCFAEVVLREPANVEALVKMARAAYRNKFKDHFERLLESIGACKRAMSVKSDYMPAYLTIIKIFEEESKPLLVRHFGRLALERDPDNEEVKRKLQALDRRPIVLR